MSAIEQMFDQEKRSASHWRGRAGRTRHQGYLSGRADWAENRRDACCRSWRLGELKRANERRVTTCRAALLRIFC